MNGKILGGHNSVVGIATRYGVDGPGIESPEGGETSRAAHTGADAHPTIRTMGTLSYPGAMRPERVAHHPPPSSARLRMGVMGWPVWYCRNIQPELSVEWVTFFHTVVVPVWNFD
jgi:hypothetical protein